MVDGVKGGAEIKGNKNSGFMCVSRMEDMIKGAEESSFYGVIVAIS